MEGYTKQDREMFPPDMKNFVGKGNFEQIGIEFLNYFINISKLKPNEHVLDVGCGIGRMAIPLTKYLDKSGRYEGFDIVKEGIDWCEEKITPKYPNFHFQLADIYNSRYNPAGVYSAGSYKFPYEDKSFDFVFLTSVFTHMLLIDVKNYMLEINRVLKNDGRCFITFFLLNEESEKLIDSGLSKFPFKYELSDCRVQNKDILEGAVAYEENKIKEIFKESGFEIKEPIYYGFWSGRKHILTFQDAVIAVKSK